VSGSGAVVHAHQHGSGGQAVIIASKRSIMGASACNRPDLNLPGVVTPYSAANHAFLTMYRRQSKGELRVSMRIKAIHRRGAVPHSAV
jgi:hypothetical protein